MIESRFFTILNIPIHDIFLHLFNFCFLIYCSSFKTLLKGLACHCYYSFILLFCHYEFSPTIIITQYLWGLVPGASAEAKIHRCSSPSSAFHICGFCLDTVKPTLNCKKIAHDYSWLNPWMKSFPVWRANCVLIEKKPM